MKRREFIAAQDRSSSMLHRKRCRRYDGMQLLMMRLIW